MYAIEFENIGKQYRLGTVSSGTISHDLNRWWAVNVMHKEDPYLKIGETNDRAHKGESEYVWALKDINFKVEEGDVVGIIGKNGAGKSTLLKLLSRVTAPTTGKITAYGRIASLLEVGTGFHPEMTGRENIYMNGAIMGMTKAEITRKLDEIIDFSGCERYIDTPVKRYSSGMTVRLGFAIAAHLEPDILVVDEVLAVGDAEFQKKAIGKMQDISQGGGRTVLFVSHNMASIRALCHSGILLSNGSIAFCGEINNTVETYLKVASTLPISPFVLIDDSYRANKEDRIAEFISFEQINKSMTYASDEDIIIHIKVKSSKDIPNCRICNTIRANDSTSICNNSSTDTFHIHKGEELTIEYTLINPGLVSGLYNVSFSIGTGDLSTGENNYDIVNNAVSFEIDKMYKHSDSYYVQWNKTCFGYISSRTKTKVLSMNSSLKSYI